MVKKKKPRKLTKFTEAELVSYFNKHILYELLMLRYSHGRLKTNTQILWNAMFAAFNVSARNLYDFLNDNGTNTEVKCYEYAGFAKSFKRSSLDKVKGPLQLLNLQVFHMGRKRLAVREGKVSLKMVDDVFEWIEKNIGHLYEAFDEEFRAKIELNRADPSYSDGMLHLTNDGNLETTNQVYELTPRGVLPAQGHTSLLQGVALVITEEK